MSNNEKEIERAVSLLRSDGQETMKIVVAALLIWLFGVLVFIPLAESINWFTKTFVSLIFFLGFSFIILRILPGAKKLIDVFAVFPAKKYGVERGLSPEKALTLFRYVFYIICSLILYGLYSPFLGSFHPAVNGIVLILVLVLIFFLLLRVFSILVPRLLESLVKS